MKYKFLLLTLITLLGIFPTSYAQPQGKQSYNFTLGFEEAQKGNNEEAMEYLSKEATDNPNNGYAHLVISVLQIEAENYDEAMSSINLAIKKLPKKDKEFTSRAYVLRAHLYTIVGDTIQALDDLNKAISIVPEDESVQKKYGRMLYNLKRYYDDMESLRQTDGFKALIEEFKAKQQ